MTRVTAAIFDLDGTLLDTLPDLVTITNKALEQCGYPQKTTAQVLSYVGNGARALMYQAVPENTPDADVEHCLKTWRALYPVYGHAQTQPYEGIPELLDALHAHQIAAGVLSNKFDAAVVEVIERYLPGHFEAVHGECADYPRKPDPTGLLKMIKALGKTPEEVAYVGDSAGDILVAQRARCTSVAVTWGYNTRDVLKAAHPDVMIDNPRELAAFLTES